MVSKYGNIGLLISIVLLSVICQVQDYSFVTSSQEPINDITDVYTSTVWISYDTMEDSYRGTGWVFKNDKSLGISYIMTAAHVISNKGDGEITVMFWRGKGGWNNIHAKVLYVHNGRVAGDVAILVVPVNIDALPVATMKEYKVNDEILIAGIQNQAPPALVSIGYITKVNNVIDKIIVNAWSWRGHSGGPLIHRKTGKVIGFVSQFATTDVQNASATECSDLSTINDAIIQAGLR